MSTHEITTVNFSKASDEQLIAEARRILTEHPELGQRASLRRLMRAKKPDVLTAGKFLWGYLTKKR